MEEKRPTAEQLAKFKKNSQDQSLSAEVRAKFKAIVDKFENVTEKIGEDVVDVVEPKKTTRKPATKKPATPRATKKTVDDVEKAKAEIKAKTGKTEEECESIIEQYRALRSKAQAGKAKAEKASAENKKRVDKLDAKGDLIEGTNEKTADAVIESTAKEVVEKIEKQVEAVEAKAEKEAKAEVAKDKTITTPKAKKEAVEAKVEEKVKAKTKTIVKRVVIDTSALLSSIATSLGKFDKDSQKEFLIKLRSDIDKLLAKYSAGGLTDGGVQVMNIQQSNLSASSVNPTLFAKGGSVGDKLDFESMSKNELIDFSKNNNIPYAIGWEKEQLIDTIEDVLDSRENGWESIKYTKGGGVGKYSAIDLLVKKPYGNEEMEIAKFKGTGDAIISASALNENSPSNYEYSVRNSKKYAKGGGMYKRGGVVGQEIVFDDGGEENTGVIQEVNEITGDYIVVTDDGRTVLAQHEIDVISLGEMRKKSNMPRKKFFGLFKRGGSVGESAKLEYLDDAYASDELKDELREKINITGNSVGDNVVISFAYTDYGGDFLDKVAIAYFKENYPENIVFENAGYNGENAYVFGEPAQEWIDTTDNYPLGFEYIEDMYYEMVTEAEMEDFALFLDDIDRDGYVFDRDEVMEWLSENRGGYYSITPTGIDFSYSELKDELIEEGLISIEEEEFAKGGKTHYNTGRSWHQDRRMHNKSESYEKPMDGRKRRFAKGGMTEHGLREGDKIVFDHLDDDNIDVIDSKGKKHIVDLDKGKRYANGGNVAQPKIGDVLTAITGVKLKVVNYDPLFGGRIKVVRMDEYSDGKTSQWMPLSKFKSSSKMQTGGNVSSMLRKRRGM